MLKVHDIDQAYEAHLKRVAIRIAVRVFCAPAVLPRLANRVSGSSRLKDDNAPLAKRQGPLALVDSILKQ